MKKISVLMSIYNEPVDMLRQSIDSVLSQTYKEIEFIIVVDKPDNIPVLKLLEQYSKSDDRIVVLKNEKNIGLAMSLNRALSDAAGDYIARMDADDISLPDRLETELKYLREKKYDLVFTERIDIDEQGGKIRVKSLTCCSDDYIKNILPYNCIVNHSSILMRANVIKKLSGYRNFYASQDYDLWLRLLTCGYRIGCVPRPLIKYRIRQGSISKKKRFVQFETARYIRKLYRERKEYGTDTYSMDNYTAYLHGKGVYDEKVQNKFNSSMQMYENAMVSRSEGNKKEFLNNLLRSAAGSKWILYVVFNSIKEKKITGEYL